ncbi:hypothetical protein ANCDUO_06277 [Ancylostoma duodenale]|uniref:MULE transposase domain-containing protein n=1 Tax=Ancylostoma duodenale TaxID=51022 RepID=A0A0C2H227_9BILA|nr:hypothetical protein ANCDUO_06277 [Ancylostoma duodenale]
MTYIPDTLNILPHGSMFVHRLEPTLHVYYNGNALRVAARNVLHTLVADGVHSFQPRQLKRKDQLHTVHGVCRNGVKVPLLYVISSKKNEKVYATIFRHLRDEFNASMHPTNLRVVIDFEKVPINAAERNCAFHLAQAWNRRRDRVRLSPSINGARKSIEVEAVRALTTVPVAREHLACGPCSEFLKYLEETWYTGIFADLWNKFEVEELKTTNLAEAYHSQLNTLMDGDHPTLSRLEALRHLDIEAESVFIRLQRVTLRDSATPPFHKFLLIQVLSHEKYIRTKDRERRETIAQEMRRYLARHPFFLRNCINENLHCKFSGDYPQGVSGADIEQYCRTMSHFVSNTTI